MRTGRRCEVSSLTNASRPTILCPCGAGQRGASQRTLAGLLPHGIRYIQVDGVLLDNDNDNDSSSAVHLSFTLQLIGVGGQVGLREGRSGSEAYKASGGSCFRSVAEKEGGRDVQYAVAIHMCALRSGWL